MSNSDNNTQDSPSSLHGIVQYLLDGFYSVRKWFVTRLAFYSLRLYGFEDISIDDVISGTYSTQSHTDRRLENVNDLDILLATSKECLGNASSRRAVITDKCKTLFTMGSLLLGLIAIVLPKSLSFDHTWMRVVCFLSVLALMNTIILLLIFFDVGRDSEISLEQEDVDLDPDNFKKNLINLYLKCQIDKDNRTDYLVDLYKVARFFFLMAFSVVVVLFSATFLFDSPKDQTEHIIKSLRGDPELIELLRGPKGVQGMKGETGKQGVQGSQGIAGVKGGKGERGRDGVINENKLIEQILNSPRLTKKIEEMIKMKNP